MIDTLLNDIGNWPELARQAKWSAVALARNCHVSLRTLERRFMEEKGKSPQKWLNENRLLLAKGKLEVSCVKCVSIELGFKQPSHFSREFKRFYGMSPKLSMRQAGQTFSI